MALHLFCNLLNHTPGCKRFTTDDTGKRFFFIQYAAGIAHLKIIEITGRDGDGIFRAGPAAQAALYTIGFNKTKLRRCVTRAQGRGRAL